MAATAATVGEKWNNEGPGDLPKGMRKEFLSFIKVHDGCYQAVASNSYAWRRIPIALSTVYPFTLTIVASQ